MTGRIDTHNNGKAVEVHVTITTDRPAWTNVRAAVRCTFEGTDGKTLFLEERLKDRVSPNQAHCIAVIFGMREAAKRGYKRIVVMTSSTVAISVLVNRRDGQDGRPLSTVPNAKRHVAKFVAAIEQNGYDIDVRYVAAKNNNAKRRWRTAGGES